MTLLATVDHFAQTARTKADNLTRRPLSFLVGSMMAGAYVGLGIILIFMIGGAAEPSLRKPLMGASFGIALTLVVFAGAELFTGHAMYMVHGWLRGRSGPRDLAKVWLASWGGNLIGSALLAALFVAGGGAELLEGGLALLHSVAEKKTVAPASELFARAMLCNWLVCLALWMAARTASDAAKCILIFWCLFAFIASGFEHSVANMTLFSIALLSDPPPAVTLAGMATNLFWVTLGNIASGAGLMGLGYWLASGADTARATPQQVATSAGPEQR